MKKNGAKEAGGEGADPPLLRRAAEAKPPGSVMAPDGLTGVTARFLQGSWMLAKEALGPE
jgi:hypothetical protein